jgi:hypothetical protein
LRELTRAELRALLARPEELLVVWPDASGERLDVIVRHLGRGGFRFVANTTRTGSFPAIDFDSGFPPFLVMGKELGPRVPVR